MSNYPKKQVRQAKTVAPPKVLTPFESKIFDSQETEEACLGAVLTNPNYYHRLSKMLDDGRAFVFNKHKWIWEAMTYLAENKMGIDTVTISQRLQDMEQLKDIGGPAFLTQLIRNTPTSVHAESYAKMVQEHYSKRQILSLASDIRTSVNTSEEIAIENVLSKIATMVDNTMDNISKRVITTMADHSNDHLDDSEEARAKGEKLNPIPSGIPGFDGLIEGFYPATYLIGARTHEGKTITLTSIALNAAIAGKSVMFCSVADGDISTVLATFYGMECSLPPQMIERHTYNDKQWSTYVDCILRMKELRLFVEHKSEMTPREIWTKANIIQRTYGLDMIVIDYLQELGIDDDVKQRIRGEREKNIYVSQSLRDIRKKFNVPVIYGAQIRLDGDHDKQPRIENAQESRNIIQHADVGIALWHERKHVKELSVSVQKNKKGNHQKGKAKVNFCGITGRVGVKPAREPVQREQKKLIDDNRKDVYQ